MTTCGIIVKCVCVYVAYVICNYVICILKNNFLKKFVWKIKKPN